VKRPVASAVVFSQTLRCGAWRCGPPSLRESLAVDGAICTLVDTITTANDDQPTGGGSGADTLVLPARSTHALTEVNNYICAITPSGNTIVLCVSPGPPHPTGLFGTLRLAPQ
jgi:hypothetical protein